MKNLLLFILLFTATSSFGQFLGIGTEWSYTTYPFTGPDSIKLRTIRVIEDTLIDGKIVFEIEGDCGCNFYPRHLYQEGSKMYYYYEDEFHILYDFSLGAGDTLKINTAFGQEWMFPGVDTIYFPIKSVEEFTKNGIIFKVQLLDQAVPILDSLGGVIEVPYWGGRIIENIGSPQCLFPLCGVCECGGNFRCFHAGNGEVFNFTVGESCLLNPITTPTDLDLSIFPNPSSNFFQIENRTNEPYDLQVFNLQGKRMTRIIQESAINKTIYTDDWPTGIYILQMHFADRKVSKQLLVFGE